MSRLIILVALLFAIPAWADTANPQGPGGGGHRPGQHDILHSTFNVCGDATTVNNNTIYYGPGGADGSQIDLVENVINGQTCDINAAGSGTEADEDALVYTSEAVKVLGMTCRNEGDAGADITFTLRTAAGATVPSVACTISDDDRDCVADIQTTTDIAVGATVAIAVSSTGNIGDGNGFVCQVVVSF